MNRKWLAVIITVLALCMRMIAFVTTILWQDSYGHLGEASHHTNINITNNSAAANVTPAISEIIRIDPYLCPLLQALLSTITYGLCLIAVRLCWPHHIGAKETSYSQKRLVITGFSQAISNVLYNYCMSGSRTAPYLTALLGNFLVPIQFITR